MLNTYRMCYFAENRVNGHREHQSYTILPFIPYSMQHLYQPYVDLNSIEIGRYYTYDVIRQNHNKFSIIDISTVVFYKFNLTF